MHILSPQNLNIITPFHFLSPTSRLADKIPKTEEKNQWIYIVATQNLREDTPFNTANSILIHIHYPSTAEAGKNDNLYFNPRRSQMLCFSLLPIPRHLPLPPFSLTGTLQFSPKNFVGFFWFRILQFLLHRELYDVVEVVLGLGGKPLARFPSGDFVLSDCPITL